MGSSRSVSIKIKVIAVSCGIIMAVIGGMATYFIHEESSLLKEELRKRAAALVENFARNCDYPLLLEDGPAVEKLTESLMSDGDVSMIRVDRADGQVLFEKSKEGIAGEELSAIASETGRNLAMREGVATLFVTRPVWPPSERELVSGSPAARGRKAPLGRVTVGFSLQKTRALILATVVNTAAVAVLITALSIAVLLLFLGRFFDPLLVIARGTRELAAGRLSHRLHIRRNDELGLLASAFNEMAQSLEDSRNRLAEVHQNLEQTVHLRTQALRDSEMRYRAFFESTGTALVIIEENGMISLVNAEFERRFGHSRSDVEGKREWSSFFSPEEVARMEKRLPGGADGRPEEPGHDETAIIDRDGQSRAVFITRSRIPGTAKRICSLIDISDRKRLEEEFSQIQKMEAIGTLAGGIAHDFNNILMGIQGYASLMLLNLESGHPHFEQLKTIEEYVRSGADLTRQLLAFARGGKYEVKPTNLNEVVENTSLLFGRTRKEIRIERRLEPVLWSADVDRGQMEQVFLNLYVNAWHAMPGGGDLTLETANVRAPASGMDSPDAGVAGEQVRITVRDTGMGMDEKTRARIFEPFFTTKEMGRGTGLGLASVYGIVKGHGGTITVESEKGKGTAFHICLPASHRAVAATVAATDVIERGHETILLVDDEEGIISVARALLTRLGYRVLTAGSGPEAVEIYRSQPDAVDLVILDMIMPGMNGGETFERLKEIDPSVRVILSSGYSLDSLAGRIMDQGCRCFIQKPFAISPLSQKIREALKP
jgi:PAS domain S-box-containing protein